MDALYEALICLTKLTETVGGVKSNEQKKKLNVAYNTQSNS